MSGIMTEQPHGGGRARAARRADRARARRAIGLAAAFAAALVSAATASAEEFLVTSRWQYNTKAVRPEVILAHGQADIFDPATTEWIGGIGFYCARPQTYIDIFVHEPGGPGNPATPATPMHWGSPTFRTSLTLNGAVMPAAVEAGIVYVDIDAGIGRVLADAFALKTPSKRLDFDVAKFATFTLVMKRIEPRSRPDTAITDFDQMVGMCRSQLDR
jgi:hypothetical protein